MNRIMQSDQIQIGYDSSDSDYNKRNASGLTVVTIAGTRPELVKLSEFLRIIDRPDHGLLYTGQHFSPQMKDVFLEQLGIEPDIDLRCGTSEVPVLQRHIRDALHKVKPSHMIVYGDTNSSLAAALVAQEIGSKLIHIEAGVRDFDLAVPEEITRIKIDAMSDLLLAPSDFCKMCLNYEQVPGKVEVTGNLIVDVCRKLSKTSVKPNSVKVPDNFVLLTMHRPENVDDPVKLRLLSDHLSTLDYDVIFPVHPRTQASMKKHDIKLPENVMPIDPVGYLEFLYLLNRCDIVLTDSGGIQEESIVLKKPCLTLRHTSARWETILLKANRLFPLDRTDSLSDAIKEMRNVKINVNPYGENVASATYQAIQEFIS
jgi:UDP-GlcNAc3NAcA epimerase